MTTADDTPVEDVEPEQDPDAGGLLPPRGPDGEGREEHILGATFAVGLATRFARGITAGGAGLVSVVLYAVDDIYEPVSGTLLEHDDLTRALRDDTTDSLMRARDSLALAPGEGDFIALIAEVDVDGVLLHVLTVG